MVTLQDEWSSNLILPIGRSPSTPHGIYDGHTLAAVIDGTEKLTGCEVERAYVDKGYRGHETANPRRVFISGQKRGVFGAIKRELRRRSAIEAVIGHMKNDGHLGRCYLKGRDGDAANAILTAVGYNLYGVLFCQELLGVFLLDLQPSVNRGRGGLSPNGV
jgi:transposase, IS5 family